MKKYTSGGIFKFLSEVSFEGIEDKEFYEVSEVDERDKERVKTILELKRWVAELEEENRELENEIGCMHRLGVIND